MNEALRVPPELATLLPQGAYGPSIADRLTVSRGQEAHSIGELTLHNSGHRPCCAFRHSASWLSRSDPVMVSPELRSTQSSQWTKPRNGDSRNVFAALADTAPHGFGLAVIQRAQDRGLLEFFHQPGQEPSPWDALCAVPDVARLGALRIYPTNRPPPDIQWGKFLLPRIADLGAIANAVKAFELGQDDLRQLLLLLYCATSLPGSRPKCTVVQDDGQLAVATFSGASDTAPMARVQVLIAQIAQAAGIDVPNHKLGHPVFRPFVITPRFDRTPAGERVPFMSAQSLLLANTDDVVDHVELLGAMRVYCQDFENDARQLWRRMLFNWLLNLTVS